MPIQFDQKITFTSRALGALSSIAVTHEFKFENKTGEDICDIHILTKNTLGNTPPLIKKIMIQINNDKKSFTLPTPTNFVEIGIKEICKCIPANKEFDIFLIFDRPFDDNDLIEFVPTTEKHFSIIADDQENLGESTNPNPGVILPNSKAYGKTYAEWSAEWWKWVLSIPVPENPLRDDFGINCASGQTGVDSRPVWFLVGTQGGRVMRQCKIPSEKAIFFPIINVEADTTPPAIPPDEQAAAAKAVIDQVTVAEATIDGVKLKGLQLYRVQSPQFQFTLPEDNLLNAPPGTYIGTSDGIWIFLEPLPLGDHIIQFRGINGNFFTEVTYNLTITP